MALSLKPTPAEPLELQDVIRRFPALRTLGNVDEPREVHTTPMRVVAYLAAGQDRHLAPSETDEVVDVLNTTYREATSKGWKATRVTGDSMEPTYRDGDIVLIQPATKAKTKDHVVCSYNGDVQVKELRVAPKTKRITLLPHNLDSHDPIPVLENDTLEIIGIVRALAHRAVSNGKK